MKPVTIKFVDNPVNVSSGTGSSSKKRVTSAKQNQAPYGQGNRPESSPKPNFKQTWLVQPEQKRNAQAASSVDTAKSATHQKKKIKLLSVSATGQGHVLRQSQVKVSKPSINLKPNQVSSNLGSFV